MPQLPSLHLAVLFTCFRCCLFSFTCSLSTVMARRRCIRNWDWRCRHRGADCDTPTDVKPAKSTFHACFWCLPVASVLLGQSEARLRGWPWNQDQDATGQDSAMPVRSPETHAEWRLVKAVLPSFTQGYICTKLQHIISNKLAQEATFGDKNTLFSPKKLFYEQKYSKINLMFQKSCPNPDLSCSLSCRPRFRHKNTHTHRVPCIINIL